MTIIIFTMISMCSIIYYFFHAMCFFLGEYETKSEFAKGFIPFYTWVKGLNSAMKKRWNELE